MTKLSKFIKRKNINEGIVSNFLAKIITFLAKGKVKSIYNSFQDPELIKATKQLEKTVSDYNKNYADNPKYKEEFENLGIKIPKLKGFDD